MCIQGVAHKAFDGCLSVSKIIYPEGRLSYNATLFDGNLGATDSSWHAIFGFVNRTSTSSIKPILERLYSCIFLDVEFRVYGFSSCCSPRICVLI